MEILSTTEALATACKELQSDEFITIDTEFIRDTTYWPKLCLIQAAGENSVYVVDPLAKSIDLSPFYELMADDTVVKVFHAARQDIEIFHHQGHVIPAPLFDTQVAAMACGFGDSIGYENLVKRIANAEIDKSSRYTDWGRRPLTDAQLSYAVSDVTHLRKIYQTLKAELEKTNRDSWLAEEMEILTSPATYNLNPQDAWKRLKIRNSARRRLGVLIELAAWRERQSQKLDQPRNRILKDEAIFEIAGLKPKTRDDLAKLRLAPKGLARSPHADDLLEAVARGLDMPKEDLPKLSQPKSTNGRNESVAELLKVLLKLQCASHGVAQKLVASSQEIEDLAADDQAPIRALQGWRYDLFGALAIKLKHGQLAFALRDNEPILIDMTGSEPKLL